MGLWGLIISQTSQSPWRLVTFGTGVVVVSAVLGNTFTSLVGPSYTENPQEKRKLDENLSYDDKRFVSAREQRISSMIKDMLDGHVDEHWNAAMRGTVVQHPNQESKTQILDSETLANAKAAASSKQKGWWGWGKGS